MKNRLAVVLKYVDGNETLEMQCIYALQALCVKHQYPQGKMRVALLQILTFCNDTTIEKFESMESVIVGALLWMSKNG